MGKLCDVYCKWFVVYWEYYNVVYVIIFYIANVSIYIRRSLLLAAILPAWHPRHGAVHLSLLKNKQIPTGLHTYSYKIKGKWRGYNIHKLLDKQFVKWCFEACDSYWYFWFTSFVKNWLHSVCIHASITLTQLTNSGIPYYKELKFSFTAACLNLKK